MKRFLVGGFYGLILTASILGCVFLVLDAALKLMDAVNRGDLVAIIAMIVVIPCSVVVGVWFVNRLHEIYESI